MVISKLNMAILVTCVAILGSGSVSEAAGKRILGGLKFDFWSSSNPGEDDGVSEEQKVQQTARYSGDGCRYENQWQQSRHGKRLEGRVRYCNSK